MNIIAKRRITIITIFMWLVTMSSAMASPVFMSSMNHSGMSDMSVTLDATSSMHQDKSLHNCKSKNDCKACEYNMCNQSCTAYGISALNSAFQNLDILILPSDQFSRDINKTHIISYISRLLRPPIQ